MHGSGSSAQASADHFGFVNISQLAVPIQNHNDFLMGGSSGLMIGPVTSGHFSEGSVIGGNPVQSHSCCLPDHLSSLFTLSPVLISRS